MTYPKDGDQHEMELGADETLYCRGERLRYCYTSKNVHIRRSVPAVVAKNFQPFPPTAIVLNSCNAGGVEKWICCLCRRYLVAQHTHVNCAIACRGAHVSGPRTSTVRGVPTRAVTQLGSLGVCSSSACT